MNWANYQKQNVAAVDMSAAIVAAHRTQILPIKAIHLRPKQYEEFKSWLQTNLKRDLREDEKMELDGVYIEKGSGRQHSTYLVELWEQHFNIQEQIKNINHLRVN